MALFGKEQAILYLQDLLYIYYDMFVGCELLLDM